jgi:hypothetical protein
MKMNAFYLSLIFFFLINTAAEAQSFKQSAGFSIIRGASKGTIENGGLEQKMWINGLTYFPRFNVIEADMSSLSIGLPVTFGFKGNANAGGSSIAFGFDAPIALDFNIGHNSSRDNENLFGGYFGAGFGYTYVTVSENTGYGTFNANAKSYGPMMRAGISFGIPAGRENLSFTIGGFYKIGMETAKFKTGGGTLLMNF